MWNQVDDTKTTSNVNEELHRFNAISSNTEFISLAQP